MGARNQTEMELRDAIVQINTAVINKYPLGVIRSSEAHYEDVKKKACRNSRWNSKYGGCYQQAIEGRLDMGILEGLALSGKRK